MNLARAAENGGRYSVALDGDAGGGRQTSRLGRLIRPLLRLRLFYKLIIANAVILALAVLSGATLAASAIRSDPAADTLGAVLPVVLVAVVLSALVNAAVVRLALVPLHRLEDTAQRIRRGELQARVPHSATSDAELSQLTNTFNVMLDSIAEYRARSRELAARALNAGEAERKRIAAELHDGVAQTLSALLLQLRVARRTADEEKRNALLQETSAQLATVTEELRAIARGLRPPALDMLGLVAALKAHARLIAETSELKVDLHYDELDRLLSPEAELALYRLVQEALSNVVRHAEARTATLDITRQNAAVIARIRDDGHGFRVDQAMASGNGLGLFGMHERASYVGGKVAVTSQPGAGTEVRIEFPVEEKDSHV